MEQLKENKLENRGIGYVSNGTTTGLELFVNGKSIKSWESVFRGGKETKISFEECEKLSGGNSWVIVFNFDDGGKEPAMWQGVSKEDVEKDHVAW